MPFKMTLKKQRTYAQKPRKFEGMRTHVVIDRNGYEINAPVYYKPTAVGVGFDFSHDPALQEYRRKAFTKVEAQMKEYYEGFDNCVRGIGL